MKKVTIQDIAAEMGLSRNTVAKALNGGLVSPQTRHAVVQKAWQMGYTKLDPNLVEEVKSTYRRSNTGTILVLFNQMQSVFWTRVLAGISNAVNDEGYRMQLHVVDERDRDGEETGRLIADDVKGIIFLSVFSTKFVKGIGRRKLPMTFFNSPINAQEYIKLGDVINVEGFYAMNTLIDYVIKQKNCTRFSYIGFAEGTRMVQARYLGFLNACNRNHIQLDERLQYTRPANNSNFNYAMVEEVVMSMPYIPEAVICEDDDVAKHVALALLQRDPQAVKKVVITGFNNTLETDFFKKDIITVDVRIEEMGRRLVKSVLDKVKCPTMDVAFTTIATYPRL
ncbi:MAG: LacI family transcriptional regulator [Lachnospiraceae bacterium]|nr:LacI family transcriptional regulator [Lachnospiraceae bacterium]MDE7272456.1 LacI family transcriptional regulator [Lachnospiraceae bacterium]